MSDAAHLRSGFCAVSQRPVDDSGRMGSCSCRPLGHYKQWKGKVAVQGQPFAESMIMPMAITCNRLQPKRATACSKESFAAAHWGVLVSTATLLPVVVPLQRSLAVTQPRRPQSSAQGAGAGLRSLREDLAASAWRLRRLRHCWGQPNVWRAPAVGVAWGWCCKWRALRGRFLAVVMVVATCWPASLVSARLELGRRCTLDRCGNASSDC